MSESSGEEKRKTENKWADYDLFIICLILLCTLYTILNGLHVLNYYILTLVLMGDFISSFTYSVYLFRSRSVFPSQ